MLTAMLAAMLEDGGVLINIIKKQKESRSVHIYLTIREWISNDNSHIQHLDVAQCNKIKYLVSFILTHNQEQ